MSLGVESRTLGALNFRMSTNRFHSIRPSAVLLLGMSTGDPLGEGRKIGQVENQPPLNQTKNVAGFKGKSINFMPSSILKFFNFDWVNGKITSFLEFISLMWRTRTKGRGLGG